MRLSEAHGRQVLSRASAERVGRLEHVVVDVGARRITALHVGGRRKKARLVDWDRIVGFGPDGIVVEDERALRAPSGDVEAAVAGGRLDLDGRLVLDDLGNSPGALDDVVFDEASGAIDALVSGDQEIDAARLRAIGPYCVLVRAA
jgi:sporulation protein YlmC with PRC-barrel domain